MVILANYIHFTSWPCHNLTKKEEQTKQYKLSYFRTVPKFLDKKGF